MEAEEDSDAFDPYFCSNNSPLIEQFAEITCSKKYIIELLLVPGFHSYLKLSEDIFKETKWGFIVIMVVPCEGPSFTVINGGTPRAGKSIYKWMIWGYPYFRKPLGD